jgi:hypothetical protein
MPRRKINRTLEEEEEFQQRRRERNMENQRRRQKTIKQTPYSVCMTGTYTIHNTHVIELNNETIGENSRNNLSLDQHAGYRFNFKSRRKQQLCLNISNATSINEIVEYYIGPMEVSCIHCHAKHFTVEKISNKGNSFHDCCNHGAIYLESLPQLPQFLCNLFDGTHVKSSNFFKHIRSYNSSFSFASFNANLTNFSNRRPGPYCFKIQGQIYYQINTALYTAQNEKPTYGQLFIVDSNEAINYRLSENSELDLEIIQNLEHIMRKYNLFAQSYQMMSDELENQRQLEIESGELLPELQLLFTLRPGIDQRRSNDIRTP